jgi:hypothetical protein
MANHQTSEDRLTLRDAAARLRATPKYRSSRSAGRGELLNALISGRLKAKIEFPTPARPSFDVPVAYWKGVIPGEFRKALIRDRSKTGDYLVRPHEMTASYADWFLTNAANRDELVALVRNAITRIPVFVVERDWNKFVEETQLDTREIANVQSRSRAGNRENEKWAPILVQVAAILITEIGQKERGAEKVANDAVKRLGDQPFIPDIPTIAEKIRDIRRLVKEISKRK